MSFHQCCLVGHVFFAVEIYLHGVSSCLPQLKGVPRLLGTEPTKHPCHSLAISLPSVAVGDTSTIVNESWGPVKLRKKLPTFLAGFKLTFLVFKKDVYISAYQHI